MKSLILHHIAYETNLLPTLRPTALMRHNLLVAAP